MPSMTVIPPRIFDIVGSATPTCHRDLRRWSAQGSLGRPLLSRASYDAGNAPHRQSDDDCSSLRVAARRCSLLEVIGGDTLASPADQPLLPAVCTENSVRVDLVIESPNVSDDGRAVLLLPDAVRLAVQ